MCPCNSVADTTKSQEDTDYWISNSNGLFREKAFESLFSSSWLHSNRCLMKGED